MERNCLACIRLGIDHFRTARSILLRFYLFIDWFFIWRRESDRSLNTRWTSVHKSTFSLVLVPKQDPLSILYRFLWRLLLRLADGWSFERLFTHHMSGWTTEISRTISWALLQLRLFIYLRLWFNSLNEFADDSLFLAWAIILLFRR